MGRVDDLHDLRLIVHEGLGRLVLCIVHTLKQVRNGARGECLQSNLAMGGCRWVLLLPQGGAPHERTMRDLDLQPKFAHIEARAAAAAVPKICHPRHEHRREHRLRRPLRDQPMQVAYVGLSKEFLAHPWHHLPDIMNKVRQ